MLGMTPSDVTTFFPVKECSWAFISLRERELYFAFIGPNLTNGYKQDQ